MFTFLWRLFGWDGAKSVEVEPTIVASFERISRVLLFSREEDE